MTRGLMPTGPVAESESRFDSKLSLSEEKDTESRDSWVQLVKVGTESVGFGHQISMQTPSLGIQPFHVWYQQYGHLR